MHVDHGVPVAGPGNGPLGRRPCGEPAVELVLSAGLVIGVIRAIEQPDVRSVAGERDDNDAVALEVSQVVVRELAQIVDCSSDDGSNAKPAAAGRRWPTCLAEPA